MSKEEEFKEKSKILLDEMFNQDAAKKQIMQSEDIERPKYPNKISWYLSDENYKEYIEFFSGRFFAGITKRKADLQNEIVEFFIKHHKNKLKTQLNKKFENE